ncbi:MAG TPA: DinB family protein [Terriglobales bacterium]
MSIRMAVFPILTCFLCGKAFAAPAAGEYAKHLAALKGLSVAVAEAMPSEHWAYKPHPESMNFGALMMHIATTNYQFCAGLKDSAPPALGAVTNRNGIIKALSDSFDYCSGVIDQLSNGELDAVHNSPDGRLPGREVLLAMYIHVAHHRGQAEIYLRTNGIKPPGYRI